MISYLINGAFAATFCAVVLAILIPLAPGLGLLDEPDSRKRHGVATPMVGGIAIYLALFVSVFFAGGLEMNLSLIFWLGLVLVVGVLDDKFDVSYRIRICVHAAIVIGIFMTDKLVVNEIGVIFGGVELDFFGPIAVLFTIFGVLGAVNSTNMMDGLDGLLGSLVLTSLFAIFALSFFSENTGLQNIPLGAVASMIGALLSFLILNSRIRFHRARVFLGDAGSTLLGFILTYLLIDYSQGSTRVFSPVLAGWILGLPLLDASAVIARRVWEGSSPFRPDRMHLHHRLIDSGMSVNRTCLLYTSPSPRDGLLSRMPSSA